MRRALAGLAAVAVMAAVGGASAEPRPYKSLNSKSPDGPVEAEMDADHKDGRFAGAARETRDIVSQPARDVGIMRTRIPPVLVEASASPYSLAGLKSCRQLSTEIVALNAVLGPDYGAPPPAQRGRAGAIASAGGRAVVNSIIPFRGVVREVTGAAPAERQYNAAVDAGLARRGFLRGVHQTRKCKTPT
ncbi:MAG: hypothetical protein IT546_12670 [Caulobacteraceae bacterium]|nr:hypothetical protein [Caulobacteraceae bacterium]